MRLGAAGAAAALFIPLAGSPAQAGDGAAPRITQITRSPTTRRSIRTLWFSAGPGGESDGLVGQLIPATM